MQLKEDKKRICPICGKEFISSHSNAKYCSVECGRIGSAETKKRKLEEEALKKKITSNSEAINAIARKTVHYGLYVAEQYLAEKARERVKQKSIDTQEDVMEELST